MLLAGKDSLSQAQGILSGEAPAMPADTDAASGLDALAADQGMDGGDEFAAADAASGEEELPTGRELK